MPKHPVTKTCSQTFLFSFLLKKLHLWDIRVNDLPRVGEVAHYLYGDEHLLLDVDGADHVMQVFPRVRQKLLHLQVTLKLVELLDLQRGKSKKTED